MHTYVHCILKNNLQVPFPGVFFLEAFRSRNVLDFLYKPAQAPVLGMFL